MKMIIVALALVAVVAAVPVEEHPEQIKILRSEFNQQPDGPYTYTFETEDGVARSETGELKQALDEEGKSHNVVVVRGSYSYTNDKGEPEVVNYFADETGYHAEGSSIPKAVAKR